VATVEPEVLVRCRPIPAGRRTLLLYGAASRNPRRYGVDVDELDLRRRPGQILTFSQSSHHCLGAAAAR
jgi:cytochrome P450